MFHTQIFETNTKGQKVSLYDSCHLGRPRPMKENIEEIRRTCLKINLKKGLSHLEPIPMAMCEASPWLDHDVIGSKHTTAAQWCAPRPARVDAWKQLKTRQRIGIGKSRCFFSFRMFQNGHQWGIHGHPIPSYPARGKHRERLPVVLTNNSWPISKCLNPYTFLCHIAEDFAHTVEL
mgnify:CR=1 FL=1